MKKSLIKIQPKEIYFYLNGEKKIIDRDDKSTHPSELYGNISSGLYGNISGLSGDISSGLYGDISGLYGCCTHIEGNLDDCELTDEERKKGIKIEDLIK